MPTAARTFSTASSHWYDPKTGKACHTVPYADPSKGDRPTTLRDAKLRQLVPSVTTILASLRKPELESWLIENGVLAALTTPRLDNEQLDAFVNRVLRVEQHQEQEALKARNLGTAIHAALEAAVQAKPFDDSLRDYVLPVVEAVLKMGRVVATERVLFGEGYAGQTDCIIEAGDVILWDFKTTKTIPKSSWKEHLLQLSAYAHAYGNTGNKRIMTGNIYISTTVKGEFRVCLNDDWEDAYEHGFKPLKEYWYWVNKL